MINRDLKNKVISTLRRFPVVGIIGCRQVGKTTLAKQIQKEIKRRTIYLDLELPSDYDKLAEPEIYLMEHQDKLVIIDEIQRMPEIFPVLRALIDKKRKNGRFLILGSASPELTRQASESLAGRIVYHELSPFNLKEIDYNINRLWLRGGLPRSYLARTNEDSYQWREAFIRTYLERDLPQLGIRIPASNIRKFWQMLSHMQGRLWNASQLSLSLGISAPTVKNYLGILEDTFIVRQLIPYHSNIKKRLVKSAKVYIRDSGLLHTLLRIKSMDDLYGHPILGSSWEGFVIEMITRMAPPATPFYYYRTASGAEIDLLALDKRNRPVAIEIKFSMTPKPGRGFWIAMQDLGCKKGFIVYPGDETYPVTKDVHVTSLKDIEKIISIL